jgi:SAM-dependent methyltransferase
MTTETADSIVRKAMQNPAVYADMAKREGEVWGRILPSLETSDARTVDAAAAGKLRAGRHGSSLPAIAKKLGLKFEHGVTLGCGAGRLERSLIKAGVCSSFQGIDISEDAIASARETAAREGLKLTYRAADLNFVEMPPATFDLAVAQTSLHHVLHLEHLAEQVWTGLKPQGCLWIHDFVGESQSQYLPERLKIFNDLLAILPEKFRENHLYKRTLKVSKRPVPGQLVSPFECIRSAEIIPVFSRWFSIEWQSEFSAFMHIIVPPGTRAAYIENEDTRALFEVLLYMDNLCIEKKILPPTGGQYLMRRRSEPVSA